MSLLDKVRGKASTLSDVDRAVARNAKESEAARRDLDTAKAQRAELLDIGADDAAQDAAERKATLAERQLGRLRVEHDALIAQREALRTHARVELYARLFGDALAAGDAHVRAARASAITAARYGEARGKLLSAGFAEASNQLPAIVPFVCDMSSIAGVSGHIPETFDMLERFAWALDGFRAVRAAA